MAEIRSYDRPDGHKGRPCKWVGAAYVITVTRSPLQAGKCCTCNNGHEAAPASG